MSTVDTQIKNHFTLDGFRPLTDFHVYHLISHAKCHNVDPYSFAQLHDKSVGACVVWHQDDGEAHVLLILANSAWCFPKGHPNDGESDVEAAAREVFEETGVLIHPGSFVPNLWFDQKYSYFSRMHKDRWQKYKESNPHAAESDRPHVVHHKLCRLGLVNLSGPMPNVNPDPLETKGAKFVPMSLVQQMLSYPEDCTTLQWLINNS